MAVSLSLPIFAAVWLKAIWIVTLLSLIICSICILFICRRQKQHSEILLRGHCPHIRDEIIIAYLIIAVAIVLLLASCYVSPVFRRLPSDLSCYLPIIFLLSTTALIIIHYCIARSAFFSRVRYLSDEVHIPLRFKQIVLAACDGSVSRHTMTWRSHDDIPQCLLRIAYYKQYMRPLSHPVNSSARLRATFFFFFLGSVSLSLVIMLAYPIVWKYFFPLCAAKEVMGILAAQICIWAAITLLVYLSAGYRLIPLFYKKVYQSIFDALGTDISSESTTMLNQLFKGRLLLVGIFVITIIIPTYLQLMSTLIG